jgi:hypothetical protein
VSESNRRVPGIAGIEVSEADGLYLDAPSEADAMTPGAECEHRFCDADGNRVYLYCQSGCGARDPLEPDLPGSDRRRCLKCGSVYPPEFVVENVCPNCRTRMAGPAAPLAIGSTWTGPDGTVYDVVSAADVLGEQNPFTDGERAHFALVPRTAAPPASEVDAIRDRAGELEAELAALKAERNALRNELIGVAGTQLRRHREDIELWAIREAANDLSEPFSANRARAAIDAALADPEVTLLVALGETRSQLASAIAANEAARKTRDGLRDSLLDIVGYPSDVEDERLFDTIEAWKSELGYVTDRCIELVDEFIGSTPTAGPVENIARIGGLLLQHRGVENRISSLVASHIVRTTEAEPGPEGLGRIELALVEGGKAKEEVKRLKEQAKKLRKAAFGRPSIRMSKRAKPARKPKPAKRKAGR